MAKATKKTTTTKKAAATKKAAPAKAKADSKKVATKKKAVAKTATATKVATKKKVAASAPAPAPVKKVQKPTKPKSPTGAYTQTEFIENLQSYCGFEKRVQAKEFLMDFSALVADTLKKGYKIPLPGIGKMFVRKTKARKMPKPGEPSVIINVPAKKKVRFTPAKSLKEAVL
jgi:nucleoid DNA-binding protein